MSHNKYDGSITADEMSQFLLTLSEDVRVVHSNGLSGEVTTDESAEYLDSITETEASVPATPWDEHESNALLNPQSLEPWEASDDNYTGRFQLQTGSVSDDGISYKFDFKAEDGKPETIEITMSGIEDNYDLEDVNLDGAYINDAIEQVYDSC
jgi:hypothetical protein